ncbi:MAG TPA: glutathione S-transferase [Azospirillaceae bacterium]|nr:glutathione S-transferase [Azospirillaceae bacterium]
MRLRYSPTSPYVRKVVMTAIELGLNDRIEREATDAWSSETTLPRDNPLGKVPALVTDDGMVLYDSPVICEYLDARAGGGKLFPSAGAARWKALRFQALGDGMCDAAILCRLERNMRPADKRWDVWESRQLGAVTRGLDTLETMAADLEGPTTIGTLSVLATLGYLDFRFADLNWRQRCPKLAAWFAKASDRPSFRDTAPPSA